LTAAEDLGKDAQRNVRDAAQQAQGLLTAANSTASQSSGLLRDLVGTIKEAQGRWQKAAIFEMERIRQELVSSEQARAASQELLAQSKEQEKNAKALLAEAKANADKVLKAETYIRNQEDLQTQLLRAKTMELVILQAHENATIRMRSPEKPYPEYSLTFPDRWRKPAIRSRCQREQQ